MPPDTISSLAAIALPVWAGISFSLIGIAFQMGRSRHVSPLRIFLLLSLAGTVFFILKNVATDWSALTPRPLILGALCGIAQYLTMRLVARANTLGPFSPIWCMLSLAFAPVILYAAAVQGIAQPLTQWTAVLLAAGCCVLAASSLPPTTTPGSARAVWAYGLLLLVILILNAAPSVALQDLNHRPPVPPLDPFFLFMYAAIAGASIVDARLAREVRITLRRGWLPGLLAGAGSISGMLSLGKSIAITGPAAVVVCSMVTLILPMLAAVIFFHEHPSLRWGATLLLGILAIALANA